MSKFTRKLTSSVAPIVNTPGVWTVNERTQNSTALVITSIVVCDSGYNELDDTAVGTSGGYLKIKGTGFLSTATVYLNGVLITPTVTSSLELRIIVPTLTVGTYSLIVFNTAAVGAIWAAGLVISGFPVWSTTTIATANLTVNTQLVATGDATLVYTLASGSLPPGVTLSSSGLLSGTISPVPSVNTVYNFTVDVKDAQNQNLAQAITFSLTVAYLLNKSLRFRSSASAYLNRTFGTPTNNKKWTWSGWVKRGALGANETIFSSFQNGSNYFDFRFNTSDQLFVQNRVGAVNLLGTNTTAVYRDPSAWYHIMFVFDSDNATAANRNLLYVNGVSVAWLANSGSSDASNFNASGYEHDISGSQTAGLWALFDGEQAEINFVDGQALAPTSFGASSIYNQWLPKAYTGTYGTNGFYLPFSGGTATSYAGLFNGSTQYLTVPNDTAFTLGATSTTEAWIYLTSATGNKRIVTNGSNTNSFDVGIFGTTNTVFVAGANANTTTAISLNTWTHVAVVFNSGTLTIYFNGVSQSLTGTTTGYSLVASTLSAVFIGAQNASSYFPGYISNLRVVKGTAVYTANFVPPTAALTAITNTSLLTLQNATIVDNSTNAFTITNTGTVVTSVQSPFLVTTTVLTADSSSNGNNWTPNNISLTAGSTYDSLTDVPTLTSATVANYAVLNPLDKDTARGTISDANLKFAATAFSTYNAEACRATMGVTTGKWYYEFRGVTQAGIGNFALTNFTTSTQNLTAVSAFGGTLTNYIGANANISGNNLQFQSSGYSASLANSTLFASYASGDVVNIAVDFTAGKIWVGKNGTWYNSGDPGAGTNATSTFTAPVGYNLPEFEVTTSSDNSNQSSLTVNFGQQPFVYTAPTGFLPLNTFNI